MWHIILAVACCAIIKLLFDQILKASKEEQYEKEAKKKEKKQAAYEEEKKLGERADEAAYYLRELFKDSEKVTEIQKKNVQWWEDQKTYKYQDSEITVTKEPLKATLNRTGEVVLEIKDGLPTIKADAPWIEYVKRRALEIKEKSEKRKAGDNLKKHIENQASLDVRLQEAKAEVPEFERKERERKQAAAKAKQKLSKEELARKKAKEEAKKKAVEAARKARTAPKKP